MGLTAKTSNKTRVLFPEAKEKPREGFVSPLSRKQDADIHWRKIGKHWKGYGNPESLTADELLMLKGLYGLQMCTNIQLAKLYLMDSTQYARIKNSRSKIKKIKGRLKDLSYHGILVKHRLIIEKQEATVYTLGPGGARILDVPYTPNWWSDISAYMVLKQLLINQLYFRLRFIDKNTLYYPTPQPFNGLIVFKGLDFLLCATEGKNVPSEIRWEKNKRLIVIVETIEEIFQISDVLKNNLHIRYTTDYDLFFTELYRAFCKYDKKNDMIIPTKIIGFKKNND